MTAVTFDTNVLLSATLWDGSVAQKVLFDCIRGDQTLFTSTKEVAAAWRFITPIIEQWRSVPLQIYKKGSGYPVKMV